MSFLMKKTWNWEDKKIENTAIISSNQEEDEKDEVVSQGKEIPDSDNEEPPPRGTKILSDIYQRCNFAGVEPENYEEAIKHDEGDIQNHKARLVARGFTQKTGIDFYETFSPFARLETIRTVNVVAAQKKWKIFQLDRSKCEATLYVKKEHGSIIIVCLYVDDLLFIENEVKMMQNFIEDMMQAYEMSDLGLLNYFLGIEVSQVKEGIFISQKKYTKSILQKFKMMDCRSVTIPLASNEKFRKDDGEKKVNSSLFRTLIGSLLYLTSTRSDIMFAASLLSRFRQEPIQVHFGDEKRVLRYLQGTMDYGIIDWDESIDDMKSNSGYAFLFGSSICSWLSKKQSVVSQSTTEAEYVSASKATSPAIWLRRIFEDIVKTKKGLFYIVITNK
ncbi:uncharacterized mitochondrial protein AtMg00810-like [Solanum lycopersicum]|uniref:uncharacterized mitochondrial protein AtMg00810-like n=1 Tax=Solanum lycopersicum TaxID=4081 RepID=UPI003747D21E